jgi:hypothetical protein
MKKKMLRSKMTKAIVPSERGFYWVILSESPWCDGGGSWSITSSATPEKMTIRQVEIYIDRRDRGISKKDPMVAMQKTPGSLDRDYHAVTLEKVEVPDDEPGDDEATTGRN